MSGLSWVSIFRIGLVQTALGAMVVFVTTTLNRVMTNELGLLAMVPGGLVGVHYALQISRPHVGYQTDKGGRRTPWIVGGLAVLGIGVILAALSTAWMSTSFAQGLALAIFAYLLVGAGVGAAGTPLLTMLAAKVVPHRRAPAATIVWLMMIAGFVVSSVAVGNAIEPFTFDRLVTVTATVIVVAFVVAMIALWGIEDSCPDVTPHDDDAEKPSFGTAFRELWAEPKARAFTVFVFVAMMAYGMQDIILESFGGVAFGMTPGESTRLSAKLNSGVFVGMLTVAFLARRGPLRSWTVFGCAFSGLALGFVALSVTSPAWPIATNVTIMGVGFGVFAAAAIAWMMALAGEGQASREGMRMGLWGAAQAIGMALGQVLGAAFADVVYAFVDSRGTAYAVVFAAEGALFLVAAGLAARMSDTARAPRALPSTPSTAPVLGAAELTS